MSDELIRKSDVLDLLNSLDLNLIDYGSYSQLFDTVDNMPPVNAVELPCKVGDTIFILVHSYPKDHYVLRESIIDEFVIRENNEVFIGYAGKFFADCFNNKRPAYVSLSLIGKSVFLDAEEAMELLKNSKNVSYKRMID